MRTHSLDTTPVSSLLTPFGCPVFDDFREAEAMDFGIPSLSKNPTNRGVYSEGASANIKQHEADIQKTIVDFLTFSIPACAFFDGVIDIEQRCSPEELRATYEANAQDIAEEVLGLQIAEHRDFSQNRYSYSSTLRTKKGALLKGSFIGYGGNGGLCVSLTGQACNVVFQKAGAAFKLYVFLLRMNGNISRVDLSLDCHNREFTPEQAEAIYDEDDRQFTTGGRGRRPKDAERYRHKKTGMGSFIVGSDKSVKRLNVYDREPKGGAHGDVRAEYRFRSGNGRKLPLNMLLCRDSYFAGASLYADYLLNVVMKGIGDTLTTAQRIATRIVNEAATAYEKAVRWLRHVGGKIINLMMLVTGEDAEAVVSLLRRDGIPERLKAAYAVLSEGMGDGELWEAVGAAVAA